MNEQKLKKKKFLNNLQHNICKNYKLYNNDFYDQFDKFLFNYSVLLLNPSKKNDLLCSQLTFLSYTSHFFSKINENNYIDNYENSSNIFSSYDDKDTDFNLSDIDIEEEDEEEQKQIMKNIKNSFDSDNEDNELLNINIDLKKKEILKSLNKEKDEKENIKKKEDNPLIIYEDLNEYINFLMIKNKEELNYTDELFFLVSQLLIHFKHILYSTVLFSIIKTIKQMKRHIDSIKYLQVLVFISDIKFNKIKYYIFKCVIDKVVQINMKTKNERLKNEILCLLHEAFIENGQKKRIRKKYSASNFNYFSGINISECINNFACSVLIELAKKSIYVNKKNVNIISEGIFYKNLKIVKCVCFALLGKYDNKELVVKIEKEKIDKNKKIDELKNISNQTHQKLSKSKIKQLHLKKEKIMEQLYNNHNSSDEEQMDKKKLSKYVNYTFIDLIYDAYKFSSNIFNLICLKYKFNNGVIKLLLLNILSRIYQRNKIIEENFFLYYENVLLHLKNKNTISKYLSIFIQCIHDYMPPLYIQRIVYVLIKKFLSEYLSEEFVYLIINAIIEIVIKFPNCLNEEIFEAVIVFKDFKNKQISSIIRRFINICKEINPQILNKKYLDKKTAMLIQKKKILNCSEIVNDKSILQYSYLLDKEVGIKSENIKKEKKKNEKKNENENIDKEHKKEKKKNEKKNENENIDKEHKEEKKKNEKKNESENIDKEHKEEKKKNEKKNEMEEEEEEEEESKKILEKKKRKRDDEENKITESNEKKNDILPLHKKSKKLKRKEEKKKKELKIVEKNQQIISEQILTDEDFKKLKKMRDYIENNKNIVLSELREICNAEDSEEESESNSENEKEKVITEEDLLYKKKLKKSQIMKMKNKKSENNRFKTNKEKEKKKSVMMLIQKFKKKKKNALLEYGKLKKKLKGKLAARAKKKGILQKRIAKKLSRRKR
ncbi:large ribosomal subunit assembling factor, putative [Plasmodium gallinaceum]|uniref:Large ribosomal subunit assembling factor, putative n=1 Tax=Plasmodium gallinaceum TaxID=5849 RepID=A0A1J1H0C1_PLAGA|nr:large ribosomal subunit assembling factor, putative [Plasmodium gallinaceum]CRG98193.1 large ribosomal subunit assembling factor, putative [Plasmodium gallinaceum]